MKTQLELIAQSYDKDIEYGKDGVNPYELLPESITNHKHYGDFVKSYDEVGSSDSKRKEIKDYLQARQGMKFIDLGCCLNLMFNDYDKWPSQYFGIDISKKTIDLLENVVQTRKLDIGGLFCASVDQTPFDDEYFDIAACIGIVEYFDEEFLKDTIIESHRILRQKGKLVIDVPNIKSPLYEINQLIEAHIGRPSNFRVSLEAFNEILKDYFKIIKTEQVVGMVQYFLEKK